MNKGMIMNRESDQVRLIARCLLAVMLVQTVQPVVYASNLASSEWKKVTTTPPYVGHSSVENKTHSSASGKIKESEEVNVAVKEPEINDNQTSLKSLSVTSLGGPGQAESSGFSLTSTDGMVDKFTGDFSYSIPLADVEGYPLVLSYNSAVGMNTEASWVGLGWDLNVGAVSRELRGLPDEFNGKQTVIRTFNQKDNTNTGGKFGLYAGLKPQTTYKTTLNFALQSQITALVGTYNDSYIGKGRTFDFGLQASPSLVVADDYSFGQTFGFGYSSDSKRGIGKSRNFGLSAGYSKGGDEAGYDALGFSFSQGKYYNSRQGLVSKTQSMEVSGVLSGDNAGVGGSYGASSTVMYGTQTSVPSISIRNRGSASSTGYNMYYGQSAGLGDNAGLVWTLGIITQDQSSITQVVLNSNRQIIEPAIGYFHSGKYHNYAVTDTQYPIMDFNRTGEADYSEEMKNLAFSIQTYDIFRVNALGLGATFRGRRNDFGTYSDPSKTTEMNVTGTEISGGLVQQVSAPTKNIIGVNPSSIVGYSSTETGQFGTALSFTTEAVTHTFDKAVYFKGVGEMTPEDMTDETVLGNSTPSYFQLEKSTDGKDIVATNKLYTNGSVSTIVSNTLNQPEGLVRSTSYVPYTAKEYASIVAIDKYNTYYSYTLNSPVTSKTAIDRLQETTPNSPNYSNHLSAIEIVNTDGMKYIFGIPAYDLNTAQVSFCATGLSSSTSVVTYTGPITGYAGDNSTENNRGVSNYFDKTVVPATAHSFLLTELQSSDYIDRLDDGPTLDDIGSYYKFNYTRLYSASTPYKWRFPVEASKAYFSRGNLGTAADDMANYAYGEKEIWYTHSIESKNIIAEFELEDRMDGCGVSGENGGLSTGSKQKRLKKIKIYNRSERLNPTTGSTAVPLQVIEFEYSYELCKNNPTNVNTGSNYTESGKLTLKSIRSYSGKSEEMGLYAYKFEYESGENPDFSYEVDAWGNYRTPNIVSSTEQKPVYLFPYADQDPTNANDVALHWKLNKITNPTGGILEIQYEADSYATVQDRRAMKHMDVKGFTNIYSLLNIKGGSTWNASTGMSNNFHENLNGSLTGTNGALAKNYYQKLGRLDEKMVPNNVVIFKLEKTIATSVSTPNAQLKADYFSDNEGAKLPLTEVFMKLYVAVKGSVKELIPTFGSIQEDFNNIESIGVLPPIGSDAFYSYGYVILKPAHVETADEVYSGFVFNSLELAAIEFIRRELPDVVYGTCAGCVTNTDIDKALKKDGDVNLVMHQQGWANAISNGTADPKLNTLRLYVPGNLKYGGNGRVRNLVYKDNWNDISTENQGVYTWNYLYPDRYKTSGNAASEPLSVLDECEFYEWETYINKVEKYPDATKFSVVPVSSILLPPPVIGYEDVIVQIEGSQNKGYSRTKYYTTHQFPMVTKKTDIKKGLEIDEPTSVLLGTSTKKIGYSQGFVVESNDFHGKPMEQSIVNYEQYNTTINEVLQSRTTYEYAGLDDTHKAIKRDGTVVDAYLAQETDAHLDARYVVNTSVHQQFGINFQLIIPVPSPPGVPFPIIIPTYTRTENQLGFYSSALVKHINRSAIVERVVTEKLGSKNTAQNELYDYQTGNVLLSSLNDEYNDRLYSFSYPAHWYYKQLREYAESHRATVSVTINSDNTFSGADNVLTEGDYVQLLDIAGTPKAVVARHNVTNQLYLMSPSGIITTTTIATGTHSVLILQSNRANKQSEMMQSVVTKHNPWSGSAIVMPVAEIISANAVTFRNRNSIKCGTPMDKNGGLNNNEVTSGGAVDPYSLGIRGDLVPDVQYSWQSERLNAAHPYKTRFDGTYASYVPFYQIPSIGSSSGWFQISQSGHPNYNGSDLYQLWRKSGAVTAYDSYGAPLESKDQIDVRAAVLYGYNSLFNLAPVAQAMNARQQDIGYDGFEDYDYYNYLIDDAVGGSATNGIQVNNTHFDFKVQDAGSANVSVDHTIRHSGLSSLKIVNSAYVTNTYNISPTNCSLTEPEDPQSPSLRYVANSCNCVPPFAPDTTKYVIGAWIKASSPVSSSGRIVVTIAGSTPQTLTFTPSGGVIDGWLRLEGVFTILPGSTTISIKLEHINGTAAYFDDVRIHPYTAGMTTTVYDPKTMLPMASHDGYNFTTFYNYDENLNLVRMRVETIDGIKTVSESEMSGYKQPKL